MYGWGRAWLESSGGSGCWGRGLTCHGGPWLLVMNPAVNSIGGRSQEVSGVGGRGTVTALNFGKMRQPRPRGAGRARFPYSTLGLEWGGAGSEPGTLAGGGAEGSPGQGLRGLDSAGVLMGGEEGEFLLPLDCEELG